MPTCCLKAAINDLSFLLTFKWFSVRTSSVRFSHSPIESVRWDNLFWSTFKMDSCFRQPKPTDTQTCGIHTENQRTQTQDILNFSKMKYI